ncbi:hypothetical protein EYF80_002900 [Liparis tanakae]|uniref:Uncharacterized protein n=1 Tax=Liparis tanakae TaxID=230148 RepID=A0A4Z2J9J8_9TELE|nr:hypothetical protein EYF80_002900 [Liparis tanakae]
MESAINPITRHQVVFITVGLLPRGERTVNHVQDKVVSKGHRQPLRLWEGKEPSFEAQNWHHNSTRSFHSRGVTNDSYPTGPGERYANWDHNASNSVSSDPGSRHLSSLAHTASPPRHHRCNQDDWKPPNERGGHCNHYDHRTSTTQQQETSKLRAGGHLADPNQSCRSRPPHHGSNGKVDRRISSSPADPTRVPYSQNHHYYDQRHTGHPRAPPHNMQLHPSEDKDSRSHHKQSTVRNLHFNNTNTQKSGSIDE